MEDSKSEGVLETEGEGQARGKPCSGFGFPFQDCEPMGGREVPGRTGVRAEMRTFEARKCKLTADWLVGNHVAVCAEMWTHGPT